MRARICPIPLPSPPYTTDHHRGCRHTIQYSFFLSDDGATLAAHMGSVDASLFVSAKVQNRVLLVPTQGNDENFVGEKDAGSVLDTT